MRRRPWSAVAVAVVAAGVVVGVVAGGPTPAEATSVGDESSFRAAFADAGETSIVLDADVELGCGGGAATRTSATPLVIDGATDTVTTTIAPTGPPIGVAVACVAPPEPPVPPRSTG